MVEKPTLTDAGPQTPPLTGQDKFKTLKVPPQPAATTTKAPNQAPLSRQKTMVMDPKAKNQLNQPGQIAGILVTYTFISSGAAFLIREGRNIIGSAATATARTKDNKASEKHAIILAKSGRFLIDDCLSTNGTFVNGKEITEKIMLQNGDVIQTGETLWRFMAIQPPQPKLLVKTN